MNNIFLMRSWCWYCYSCGIERNYSSKEDTEYLADNHDKEFHDNKSHASYGYQVFWTVRLKGN